MAETCGAIVTPVITVLLQMCLGVKLASLRLKGPGGICGGLDESQLSKGL